MQFSFIYCVYPIFLQNFIQAILMSGRWCKKLNLLSGFSSSIFIIFFKKHIGFELAVKINQLTSFLLFLAISLFSRCKKVKTF